MSSDIAIKVENLGKCYQIYDRPRDRLLQMLVPGRKQYAREFWALKDVSFEVRKGESVGIVGRNGSGKSTLLQIVAGTLSPTTGSISSHGRIAALLELGSGFNPDFSGRENVYLNGALLGFSRQQIDHKFDAIAAFADIGQHLDQPTKTYSSGMVLRLAFAVQVQVEPDILIVDEALAVGDALFQKRCFQQIEKLLSNGTTLLFVSHDQESIRTLTNRALLLSEGRAVSWGPSSEVILDYRRLLHHEESDYFTRLANDMTERARAEKVADASGGPGNRLDGPHESSPGGPEPAADARTERLSFGDGEATIVEVLTLDAEGSPCSVYYPGQPLRIRIACMAHRNLSKLNVAVRLRNKEGVKIYSWGTLNQDMTFRASRSGAPLFWTRHFTAGEQFQVVLECACNLGVNLYEVQAAVSREETPDYLSQRMLHWVDEAAFFQVAMKRDEYFFGGVTDLKMKATW